MRSPVPLALSLALVASACIPTLGEDAADERVPTPDPAARPGGTITIATPLPASLDPGLVADPATGLVVSAICDTLVSFDPVTSEPRPAIASSWTITRGGRKLFVKLRRGVRFHDGRALTAQDVTASLSRLASQTFASPSASLLAPVTGFGFVHGEEETDNPRLRRELIGVSAADRLTVEITLDEPRADFIRVLGHPATAPIPRADAEADPAGFARAPVCAGPYRVAGTWSPGEAVALERFEDYHGANAAFTRGGAGYADEIRFVPPGSPADVARGRRGTERAPGGRIEFLGLPTSLPPFDDPAVREAIARALDRRSLARAAPTPRRPATAHLPGGPRCVGARGDVSAARALLVRAGVTMDDVRVPLFFNDEHGNRALASALARQLRRALGVRLVLEPLSFETLLERGRSRRGLPGAFRFSWETAYPGPEPFLVPLFDDSSIGLNNLSRYDSAAFADELDDARRTLDDDERAEAYTDVAEVLCREMPMVPLTVDERVFRVRARVASAIGRVLDAAAADPIVRELYVRA